MRTRRQRVFRVIIDGVKEWTEEAGTRSVHEYQHYLATHSHTGKSVKVQEQFLGGAKAKVVEESESEDDQLQ